MHLVSRSITDQDLPSVIRLCRPEHVGNESAIQVVRDKWNTLWENLNPQGVVIEDLEAPQETRALGLMMTLLLDEECFQKCLKASSPYLLHNLAQAVRDGTVCALDEAQIAARNAGDGLHLLVCYIGWQGSDHFEEPAPNLRGKVVMAYSERHGGHRLKSMFGECSADVLDVALKYGNKVLNDYRDWAAENDFENHPKRPYVVGVTKEGALEGGNFWFHRMFTYFPPKFHFTQAQRLILKLARDGYTDAEIAAEVGTSPDAVKKRWVAIYQRVHESFPALLPSTPEEGRGAEKRRALLMHLRERPEELQPFKREGSSRAR